MRISRYKLMVTVVALLILVSFVGCNKKKDNQLVSEPVISADVPVDEVKESEILEQEKSDAPEESQPTEPVHIGVERITLDKYSVNIVQGSSDMPRVTMHPTNCTNKAEVWVSDNTDIATVDNIGRITGVGVGNCTVTVSSVDNPNAFVAVAVTVTPYVAPQEPEVISVPEVTTEPEITYVNGILIANKTYPLPSSYNPGVDPVANSALQEMFAAAKADGLNLFVKSGFRSYSTQQILYNNYVKRDGVEAADRYSARAGHSEHQTGLAFDINKASSSFTGPAEAIWLAENCYKYGFIIRYPEGKESVTGYMYESWHIRYLGVDIATAVYNSGLCLEEYLGITSSYQ